MTLEDYFFYSGILFNLLIALLVVLFAYEAVIFPAIIAVSICRWYAAIFRKHGTKNHTGWLMTFVFVFKTTYTWADPSAIKVRQGIWRDVGDWVVFSDEEGSEK